MIDRKLSTISNIVNTIFHSNDASQGVTYLEGEVVNLDQSNNFQVQLLAKKAASRT